MEAIMKENLMEKTDRQELEKNFYKMEMSMKENS